MFQDKIYFEKMFPVVKWEPASATDLLRKLIFVKKAKCIECT